MRTLTPTAVWRLDPALIAALDARLGSPVDSYLNGTQTWLTDEEGDGVTLEWHLHPAAGYQAPMGLSHYDVWDAVVGSLDGGADPTYLDLAGESRSLSSLWEGLECFPAYGDEIEPQVLASTALDTIGVGPDATGLVDHTRIGKIWEDAHGQVSIFELLLAELSSG